MPGPPARPQVPLPLPGRLPPVLAQRVLAQLVPAPALKPQALRGEALALALTLARRRRALPLAARPVRVLAVRLALPALLARRWPGQGRGRRGRQCRGALGLALACAF